MGNNIEIIDHCRGGDTKVKVWGLRLQRLSNIKENIIAMQGC